jgi:glycosyltransferase involved in cell wall biosynthesis
MPDSRGGIETYVEMLAHGQASRGLEPWVLCASSSPSSLGLPPGADRVLRLPFLSPLTQLEPDFLANQQATLRQRLQERRIELLHVHHWHGIGPALVQAARSLGIPAVVTLHDYFATCPLFFRRQWGRICEANQPLDACWTCLSEVTQRPAAALVQPLSQRNGAFLEELRSAAAVLALSLDQLQMLQRLPGLEGLPIECPGFPARHLGLSRGAVRSWVPPQPLKIATWGGLVEGKGLHTLVYAVKDLPPGSVEIHHHGPILDQPYFEQLKREGAGLALHFHGPFDPRELGDFGSRYDLAVHPSLFLETYGYTTDEAIELGLPVIVPDRGAPRERIGTRGQTYRFGDPQDLARLLARVLAEPALLTAWRSGAPTGMQDLSGHLDRLESIYARVMGI